MRNKGKRLTLLLLVATVLFMTAGQYYLNEKREFLWDGVALYALGAVCFALLVRRSEPRAREGATWWTDLRDGVWAALHKSNVRLALALAGLAISLYVTVTAEGRPWVRPFYDLLALWGVAIALVAIAFAPWRGWGARLRGLWAALSRNNVEASLVVLVVAATFFLRAYQLQNIPPVLSGDEASMGLEALDAMEGRRANPFITGWFSNPMLYFWMQGAFMRVLGVNVAALRLPSTIISAATALLLYLFARRYYGRWVALVAMIFFATYHYTIHFGRLAYNNIWDPFYGLGAFYFVGRGIEKRSVGWMAMAGLVIGSSIYFHAGTRLVVVILAVYLLYLALQQRGFVKEHLPRLVVLGFVALVVTLPLLRFYQTHLGDMMAPWARRAIYPMGWVDQQMQMGRSEAAILFEQFTKAALAFNYQHDPTFHYRPGISLLQFIPAVLFVLGFVYALMHLRRHEYWLPVVWLVMTIIFGGMLLENPPSAHRLLLSAAPVSILVALGLVRGCTFLGQELGNRRILSIVIGVALLALTSYQSVHFYFGVYTAEEMFSDTNTHVADRLGKYLHVLGPGYQAYFFGAPRLYCGHATIPFLSREITCVDTGVGAMPAVDASHNAVFVFVPERQDELQTVRQSFPSGILREFRDVKGQLLFIAYEVVL